MRKMVIFIADSLDNAHKFQQVLSGLDVDVAAGSSVQFKKLLAQHPSYDLVVYEARADALANVSQVESVLLEDGSASLLVIVNEEQLAEFRLPVQVKSDFVVHGATERRMRRPHSAAFVAGQRKHVHRFRHRRQHDHQPGNVPGHRRRGTARLHVPGIRAAGVSGHAPRPHVQRATRFCAACGASTTTAAAAPSTCTCVACARSWAPSWRSTWKRCAASVTCGARKAAAQPLVLPWSVPSVGRRGAFCVTLGCKPD